jgi:hypothetical protein
LALFGNPTCTDECPLLGVKQKADNDVEPQRNAP